MNTQPLQLEPFSKENKKFFRVFNWLAALGLGIAICITFFFGIAFIENSRLINMFIDAVATLVPAVTSVAAPTQEPVIARFVLASQWLLFPFYFFILLCAQPPWGKIARKRMAQIIIERKSEEKIGMSLVVIFIYLFFATLMILNDFGFHNFAPSFFTGSIFDSGAWILSMQKKSAVGLVLVAWMSPLMETILYIAFLLGISWLQLFFSGDYEML